MSNNEYEITYDDHMQLKEDQTYTTSNKKNLRIISLEEKGNKKKAQIILLKKKRKHEEHFDFNNSDNTKKLNLNKKQRSEITSNSLITKLNNLDIKKEPSTRDNKVFSDFNFFGDEIKKTSTKATYYKNFYPRNDMDIDSFKKEYINTELNKNIQDYDECRKLKLMEKRNMLNSSDVHELRNTYNKFFGEAKFFKNRGDRMIIVNEDAFTDEQIHQFKDLCEKEDIECRFSEVMRNEGESIEGILDKYKEEEGYLTDEKESEESICDSDSNREDHPDNDYPDEESDDEYDDCYNTHVRKNDYNYEVVSEEEDNYDDPYMSNIKYTEKFMEDYFRSLGKN
jgi:hypothetical protein